MQISARPSRRRRRRRITIRFIRCGCGGSAKSTLSISDASSSRPSSPSSSSSPSTVIPRRQAQLIGAASSSTPTSSSNYYNSAYEPATATASAATTPSVSGLLRQLGELELGVLSLHSRSTRTASRTTRSDHDAAGGGIGSGSRKKQQNMIIMRHKRSSSVNEGVPVLKESLNPLADFRQSMLRMIIEKEIVTGDELRELLRRFLTLNAPRHHPMILQAFGEIWQEVFAGYEDTPDHGLLHYQYDQMDHSGRSYAQSYW